MKRVEPTPLSTDTICRVGWRSSRPLRMILATTRALPMNSSVPPMANVVSSCCDAHGVVPT